MVNITLFRNGNQQVNKFPVYILDFFPVKIRNLFTHLPLDILNEIEEIRFRINRPLIIVTGSQHLAITPQQKTSEILTEGYIFSPEDMEKLLHKISQSSIYAWEEEFRRGYITISGGHRIGLVGKAILDKGLVKTLKEISGLNFRIAKEIIGVADKILPFILGTDKRIMHTLLVSPPQCGKTTLLRDMIRQISSGIPGLGFPGVNVGLVDERSELAGTYMGISQFDIGLRTDILDSCPKSQGMIMLIRSMSPQVIATDEIGTLEDIRAMEEVLNAGISLITTVHGRDINELRQRPNLRQVIENKFFKRIIILGRSLGVGTIEQVFDGITMQSLITKPIGGRTI